MTGRFGRLESGFEVTAGDVERSVERRSREVVGRDEQLPDVRLALACGVTEVVVVRRDGAPVLDGEAVVGERVGEGGFRGVALVGVSG